MVDRATLARAAGISLLIAIVSVLVLHGGPGIIAGGNRVSGTSDLSTITAFYSHPSMRVFWWQGGVAILAILFFAAQFRRYLLTFPLSPMQLGIVDFATYAAIGAAPMYAVSGALEPAMVQLVGAGESGSGLLAVFVAWDWIYNSFAYFFEFAYMAAWAVVVWQTRALPRWIAALGALTAVGHLFNSQVLLSGMSDTLTLIPTVVFIVWFIATGIYLLRGGALRGSEE
jgi:hypothetical protein